MGMLKTLQVHATEPLTSNQNATIQIPSGGKINSLFLYFRDSSGDSVTEAQIRAEMSTVRLSLGGRDIINAPLFKLLDLYEFFGVKVAANTGIAGVVELNIGKLIYLDPIMRDACGFGTADIVSIQVSVTAGTLSNIASVQAFTRRQAVEENLSTHCRFVQYPQTFNSTGDHTVDTLPRDRNSAYLAVMVDDGASGAITNGEARVNSNTIIERCPINVNAAALSNDGYVQPAGYFVYPFTDGTVGANLPMTGVTDFRLINTFGTAPGTGGYTICPLTVVDLNLG